MDHEPSEAETSARYALIGGFFVGAAGALLALAVGGWWMPLPDAFVWPTFVVAWLAFALYCFRDLWPLVRKFAGPLGVMAVLVVVGSGVAGATIKTEDFLYRQQIERELDNRSPTEADRQRSDECLTLKAVASSPESTGAEARDAIRQAQSKACEWA